MTKPSRPIRVRTFYCSAKNTVLKQDDPWSEVHSGFIRNISEDGVCLSSSHAINPGDLMRIEFYLPGIEEQFDVKAKAIWTSKEKVGFKFVAISDTAKRSLGKYLAGINAEDLYEYYQRLQGMFTYKLAGADEMAGIYKLRYLIYVKEFGWEPPNPTGMETDAYEGGSIYFAVKDNNSTVIASTRLIPASRYKLPIEEFFEIDVTDGGKRKRSEISEISRLCIAKEYRRRIDDLHYKSPEVDAKIRSGALKSRSPNLLFGLWKLMFHYSAQHGIKFWFMETEHRLANSLINAGMNLVQVGEPKEYHGVRVPYFIDIENSISELEKHNPALLNWFKQGF